MEEYKTGAGTPLSEWTKCMRKADLKQFFKWLYDKQSYPDVVEWIPIRPDQTEVKKIEKTDLITRKEYDKLIQSAPHPQQRALIACLYEMPMRIQELVTVRIKDVRFKEVGVNINLNGTKTAFSKREPLFIRAEDHIKQWYDAHPFKNDPNAPFFIALDKQSIKSSEPHPLTYSAVGQQIREIARRSGINKRVNTHIFRYTSASDLYESGFPVEYIETLGGWSPSSKELRVYLKTNCKKANDSYAELRGVKVVKRKGSEQIVKVECERCGQQNNKENTRCWNCGKLFVRDPVIELTTKYIDKQYAETGETLKVKVPQVDEKLIKGLWKALNQPKTPIKRSKK